MTQQVALSTGTVLSTRNYRYNYLVQGWETMQDMPYQLMGLISGLQMWPAQTIETQQGNQLQVTYLNTLNGARYSDFNILADQTLMMNGYTLNGNPLH